MNVDENIEFAESLLAAAKEVTKRPKESGEDRKRDEIIVVELLDFARVHAMIAQAQATRAANRQGRNSS